MENKKRNIAIIGPAYPLRGGGMATFNERLARQFQNEGHQVTIYTFSLQYPSFLFPGTTQYSTEAPPADLNIKVLINSINPFKWIKAGRAIRQNRHDIVIVRYWLPFMGPALGTILRIVKGNKHSKVICIADNIIPHEKRPGDNLFTKYFVPSVDGFVTMSQKVHSDLKTFTTTKKSIQVNHPLYDNFGEIIPKETARLNLNIDLNSFIILFFGFIRKYKGLDMLIDVMPTVINAIPEARLLIAGEFYGDKTVYEEQIAKLGLSDKLILHTHFIADKDIKDYLCAADVVVQPYRNATQSGVTPLAYHFEKPMIVTNVGGLPDMVPDGIAGLVAQPDSKSIAEKIIEYYKKNESFFLPGLKAEKKKYSWERFTQQIVELVDTI